MSFIVRAAGSLLLLLAALAVSRGYSSYADERLGEGEEMLLFLRHLRNGISGSGREVKEFFFDFRGERLQKSGFFRLVREGEAVSSAWEKEGDGLHLPDGMKRALGDYFRELGRGYRDTELAAADRVIGEISALLGTERDELPKSVGTVRLISVAAALGIMILLL